MINENGVDYKSVEVADTSFLSEGGYMPHWQEIFTGVPTNIYALSMNSFRTENLSSISILAGSTAFLLATDKLSYHLVKKNYFHNKTYHQLASYAVWMGDGKINFGIAGLFSAYGLLFEDNIALRTGIQCAESILSTGLTVQVLKRITGRESPASSTSQSGKWRMFPNPEKYQKDQSKYYSFPSGHLSTAVTTFTVIAENYPDNPYIKPLGYPLIGLLGVGLVAKNMHWFSDFPLAYALGYSFGKLITSANFSIHGKEQSSNPINISLMPTYINESAGVGMMVSF